MEIQQLEPEKLTPWDKNPRTNDHAVDAVAESIRQFGFNVPILCDQPSTIKETAAGTSPPHGIKASFR